MYVKIIQCSKPTYWYNTHLGDVFEVEDVLKVSYRVINDVMFISHYIEKKDCIIVDYQGSTIPVVAADNKQISEELAKEIISIVLNSFEDYQYISDEGKVYDQTKCLKKLKECNIIKNMEE